MNPIERLLAALRDHGYEPKRGGNGWTCRCPSHDDRSPSLSIGTGDDGRALVKCHAGCATADVLAAVGLELRDLMPDTVTKTTRHKRGTRVMVTGTSGTTAKDESTFKTARAAVAELERRHGARSALWTYTDADGSPVGLVVRWNRGNGKKDVRPVSLHGARWKIGGMGEPRPLYQLPALAKAERVYITEGEPAADAAIACGLVATTSPHGSKSAAKADWSPLRGRDVVILPDHDQPGEDYAADVVALVCKAGARSVWVVRLADRWPDLPAGGDMADVLELAGGDADAVRLAVEELTDAAEPEDPPTPGGPARFTPFPVDVLPKPARALVVCGARALQTDPAMVASGVLATLAAAIGNTRTVELVPGWREPAVLWCAVVAPSGTGKSPALELATEPAEARDRHSFRVWREARDEYETAKLCHDRELSVWKRSKSGDNDPPPSPQAPACERFVVDDVTIEALAATLVESPRGVLLSRDELAAWLGSFTRYASSARAGGEEARWLPMHRAQPLKVDRRTSGPLRIPKAALCIAGMIQPGVLRTALNGTDFDSGLVARLLLAMPPTPQKRWAANGGGLHPTIKAGYAAMVEKLYALDLDTDEWGDPAPRALTLDAEAVPAWAAYYDEVNARMQGEDERTRAMLSKLEGGAARLALVVHLGRWAAEESVSPERIDAESMRGGIELAQWFTREAARVYSMLSEDEDDREQRWLAEWIAGKGGSVTARDLTKGLRAYRGDPAKARDALAGLVEAGYGSWETPEWGRAGGRPTRRFVLAQGVPVPETQGAGVANGGNGDGDSGDNSEDDGWGVL